LPYKRGVTGSNPCRHHHRPPKDGFPDVVTLHALVSPLSDLARPGTDITLTGVKDAEIEAAKGFFLRYSGERLLESTEYGQVLARSDQRRPARVYVKGLFVADEPNFPVLLQHHQAVRPAAPGAEPGTQ
jgi:hypothetical protein